MKAGDLVRLKDFEGREFPLWKTFERMYYEPEAGTLFPEDLALIIAVDKKFVSSREPDAPVGLKLISSRGIIGWNQSRNFEVVK